MRMWLVDPTKLCDQHLRGEHVELHMLVGAIHKKMWPSIKGLARDGFIDTTKAVERHKLIAEEMVRRGFNHKSPLPSFDDPQIGVDSVSVDKSVSDLRFRCKKCTV